MKKVRIGLIGVGNIARLHALGYRETPEAELYAVCDIEPQRVEQRRQEWGATKAYTDYRQLLADDAVDAVEIITPHHLHLQMGLDAIKAGKHVSMQKPMATTVAECTALVDAARESGKIFRTFENFQYYPPIVRAKELLDAGEIGDPISIRMKVVTGMRPDFQIPVERWSWRFDPKRGGGGRIMLDYGSHMFALAIYFMGDVEKVFSWITHTPIYREDWLIDSPAMVMWKYKDRGKYGHFEVVSSEELYVPSKYVPEDEWIEITGRKGFIWVNRCSAKLLDRAPVVMYRDGVTHNYNDLEVDWSVSFIAGCREFANAVITGSQPRLTAEAGRDIIRFCRAVEQSAREGREVMLDDKVQ